MKKQIYLISGRKDESYEEFKTRILEKARETSVEIAGGSIRVSLTQEPPPFISVIPFKKKKIAAFSVIREDESPLGLLKNAEGYAGMYTVEEAIPVSYRKSWKDGEITPGACLLTLFRKKPGIDRNTFLDRWHHGHTPLSLRIHPLWHYNRNVVTEATEGPATPWDGIVEEHFRTRGDLLNPFLFFGSPLVILPHMMEVYRDTCSFLDYKSIEPYLVREYRIRS